MKLLRYFPLLCIATFALPARADVKKVEPISIHGKWKFSDPEAAPFVVTFKADGTLVRTFGKKKTGGSFSLSDDASKLSVTHEEDEEEFDVLSLTEEVLLLGQDEEKFKFTRMTPIAVEIASEPAAEVGAEDGAEEDKAATIDPGKPSLVGVWNLHAVEGEELSEREKEMTVEFKADGTVLRKQGDRERPGKYEVSEDGKTVVLITGDPERNRTLKVLRLDGNTFTFQDDEEMVTLKRAGAKDVPGEDAPPAELGDPGRVVGRWRLSSVAGEDLSGGEKSMVFEFKADGTISRMKGDSERKGTYTVAEDGKTITLVRDGSDDKDVMRVIALTETTLAFDDDGKKVVLTRIGGDGEDKDAPAEDGADSGASRSSEGSEGKKDE